MLTSAPNPSDTNGGRPLTIDRMHGADIVGSPVIATPLAPPRARARNAGIPATAASRSPSTMTNRNVGTVAARPADGRDPFAAVDASGGCIFGTFGMGGENFAALLSALTGVAYTVDDYVAAGQRIWNLERLYNNREGFTRKDDCLPPRLVNEAVPAGPSKGWVNHLDPMLDEYYRARAWDSNGVPTPKKLADLELADLI